MMSDSPLGLVKPPQTKHGTGLSVVYLAHGEPWGRAGERVYIKTQKDYECRPAWRGWRSTPTFVCEARALAVCKSLGIPVPEVLSLRMEEGVAELVLGEIKNALSLYEFFEFAGEERFLKVFKQAGYLVGQLHAAGWVHGALGTAHILIQPDSDDGVWLIDLEKAHRTIGKRGLQRDLDRLWRRASCLQQHHTEHFMAGYKAAFAHSPSQAALAIS